MTSGTNLKLDNVSVTPQLVKKGVTNHEFFKNGWSWLCSSDCSKEQWTWTFLHSSWNVSHVSKGIFFSRLLGGLIYGHCIQKWWGKVYRLNPAHFEKILNHRLADHIDKCGLISNFRITSCILDQMQIFWWLYVIEMLGFLIGFRLHEL